MFLYFSFGESKDMLKPGAHLEGAPPVVMSDLMSAAGDTIEDAGSELTELLGKANDLLATPGLKGNIAKTVEKAPALLVSLTEAIDGNKERLSSSMNNISTMTQRLSDSASILESQLQELKDKKIVSKIDGTLEGLNALMAKLDTSIVSELGETIEGASVLMSSLNDTAKEVQSVVSSMGPIMGTLGSDSEGTLGQLLHNGELHGSINEFLNSGTELLQLLEEQPNSIIFGKRKRKKATEKEASQEVAHPQPVEHKSSFGSKFRNRFFNLGD
jgi:ABC-type transporter Mla subunit MlaD